MQSLIMRARTSFLATWRSLVCVRDVGWSVGSPKIVLSRSAKVYSQPPAPRIIYVLKSVSETERKAKHVKKKKNDANEVFIDVVHVPHAGVKHHKTPQYLFIDIFREHLVQIKIARTHTQ